MVLKINQRQSVRGLGLNKLGQVVSVQDTPENRGMINKAIHLLEAKGIEMKLNELKPNPKESKKVSIGRGTGSGFGKTSGKGHKGLKSRSGGRVRIGFEGGQMPLQKGCQSLVLALGRIEYAATKTKHVGFLRHYRC